MLSCEEAFLLGQLALAIDPRAILGVGPVPVRGQDKVYPPGAKADDAKAFVVLAEKAPNARGVRRVLEALSAGGAGGGAGPVLAYEQFVQRVRGSEVGAVLLTGNYPLLDGQPWGGDDLIDATGGGSKFRVLIDTLASRLSDSVDVLLPGATWLEKSGTFENWRNLLQAFEQAIPTVGVARAEGQIAIELSKELARAAQRLGVRTPAAAQAALRPTEFVSRTQGSPGAGSMPGVASDADDTRVLAAAPGGQMWQDQVQVLRTLYNAADVRALMARTLPALGVFATGVLLPEVEAQQQADMAVVEL
jgi:NADH-quinone oxidoreductase subunit G